jgi:hypothetical protein
VRSLHNGIIFIHPTRERAFMNDSEVRALVLRALYEIRHTNPHAAIPADVPSLLGIETNVLLGILRQLRDKGLIDFTPMSGGANMLGRGKIWHTGDVVEDDTTHADKRMTLREFISA